MDVRLIDTTTGDVHAGTVGRITAAIVQVRVTATGARSECLRKNGKPFGTYGLYSIHPDDLKSVQELPLSGPAKRNRGRPGTPGHWNV